MLRKKRLTKMDDFLEKARIEMVRRCLVYGEGHMKVGWDNEKNEPFAYFVDPHND